MRIRWCSPPTLGQRGARRRGAVREFTDSILPRAPMLFRIFTVLAVVALVIST